MNIIQDEYHGFLEGKDEETTAKIIKWLNEPSALSGCDDYYAGTTCKQIAEEVVFRRGKFLTAAEAKAENPPFSVVYDDIFFAKFPYLDDEERPANKAFDCQWTSLDKFGYTYGLYMEKMYTEGRLNVSADSKELAQEMIENSKL